MKKTIKIEGQRTWEGPLDNYNAHKEVVEHWCDGGEVEIEDHQDQWIPCEPQFASNRNYRIKQREPKRGEVWVHITAGVRIRTPNNNHNDGWVGVDGIPSTVVDWTKTLTYSAPSVEAYYARKVLDNANELFKESTHPLKEGIDYIYTACKQAAQLEADNG